MTAIDTDRVSSVLRERGIDADAQALLISRLAGSEQEQDLSEPANCDGFGRIRHFVRATPAGWPDNPLPIDPAARYLATSDDTLLRAQVFQNAVCNWRCWYCYVDFPLLSGNSEHSEMLTADRLAELYLEVPDRPGVIDLSGGQPDLVPEWIPWMIDALERRGIADSVYLWSDDNLSNDYFWTKLTDAQRTIISDHPGYGKVCCFKGFDSRSFAFNTRADPALFDRQFELMARLLRDTTIDLYAYATWTSPTDEDLGPSMTAFVDRLQQLDPMLPLRLVPLRVAPFTPVRSRGLTGDHDRAIIIQDAAVTAWQEELDARFSAEQRALPICDVALRAG